MMKKIVAISDIHGNLDWEIPECDICVCSGDFSPLEIQNNYSQMMSWIKKKFIPKIESLPCKNFVFIAGNHDFCAQNINWDNDFTNIRLSSHAMDKIWYLNSDYAVVDGVSIYGCPYTEMPYWAFSTYNYELVFDKSPYDSILEDMDILLVHQAPDFCNLGSVLIPISWQAKGENFGSRKLLKVIEEKKPKVVVCGHIHTGEHKEVITEDTRFFNASLLDESYQMRFLPQVFEIDC